MELGAESLDEVVVPVVIIGGDDVVVHMGTADDCDVLSVDDEEAGVDSALLES